MINLERESPDVISQRKYIRGVVWGTLLTAALALATWSSGEQARSKETQIDPEVLILPTIVLVPEDVNLRSSPIIHKNLDNIVFQGGNHEAILVENPILIPPPKGYPRKPEEASWIKFEHEGKWVVAHLSVVKSLEQKIPERAKLGKNPGEFIVDGKMVKMKVSTFKETKR